MVEWSWLKGAWWLGWFVVCSWPTEAWNVICNGAIIPGSTCACFANDLETLSCPGQALRCVPNALVRKILQDNAAVEFFFGHRSHHQELCPESSCTQTQIASWVSGTLTQSLTQVLVDLFIMFLYLDSPSGSWIESFIFVGDSCVSELLYFTIHCTPARQWQVNVSTADQEQQQEQDRSSRFLDESIG